MDYMNSAGKSKMSGKVLSLTDQLTCSLNSVLQAAISLIDFATMLSGVGPLRLILSENPNAWHTLCMK